jgi:cytochrome c oxidase subunit 1
MFGLGMGGLAIFHIAAGHLGVARRHWDITFSDAAISFGYSDSVHLIMGLAGVFALVGALGALFFILVAVGTITIGKPRPDAAPAAVSKEGVEAATTYGSKVPEHGKGWECPGSFTLALVLLTFLIVYYFANWKYLSTIWGVG